MRATTRRPPQGCRAGRILILPALLFLAAPTAQTAPRPIPVRFSVPAELRATGLKFRIPPDLSETPVPAPAVQLYQVTDVQGTRVVECLDPIEVWRQSQIEGMWSDTRGVALVLATVKSEMPAASSPHLPKEIAAEMIAKASAPTNWALETLTQWVANFAGQPVSETTSVQRPPSTVHEAWLLTLGGGDACGILFRPYRTVSLRRTESPNYYFARVRVPAGVDAASVTAAFREDFLPSVSAFKPSTDPTPKADTRFQNRRAWDKTAATAELEASRKRVADSIRNLRDWWYADTPHYVLLSDLPSRNRQVVKELQARTERYRAAFEDVFPPPAPATAVSVIRVFATDEAYDAFVGPDYTWTTGMWVPTRRELVARPMRAEFHRAETERFLQVVAHEAFHQFVSATMEPAMPAPWFNEGHAELFAQSTLDRDRLIVAESPLYTPLLERLAKTGSIDAGRLLTMTYAKFYDSDKDALAANYATAWGVVYYLHKSAGADSKSPFREVIPRYRKEITAQQEGKSVATSVLSMVDPQTLNRDVNAFWSSNSRRQAAKRNPLLVSPP